MSASVSSSEAGSADGSFGQPVSPVQEAQGMITASLYGWEGVEQITVSHDGYKRGLSYIK